MGQRRSVPPPCPAEWKPLVSPRQWADLAHAFADVPELLGDLCVILEQLSPRVRGVLLANVSDALASGLRPGRAVWTALAVTAHELKLSSAAQLGRLDAMDDDSPPGSVTRLEPPK